MNFRRTGLLLGWTMIAMIAALPAFAAEERSEAEKHWLSLFANQPLTSSEDGVCAGEIGKLPTVHVVPQAAGPQLVRLSVPFAPGALPEGMAIEAVHDCVAQSAGLRVVTLHPGKPRSVRRGMVTFAYTAQNLQPVDFALRLTGKSAGTVAASVSLARVENGVEFQWGAHCVRMTPDSVTVTNASGSPWTARLIAPPRASAWASEPEIVEANESYLWLRLLTPDAQWPRILEIRMDSLGRTEVQAHLQRLEKNDSTAPDFGWILEGLDAPDAAPHAFDKGESCTISAGAHTVSFPDAPRYLRGAASAQDKAVRYLRCTADEKVPFQESAWLRAAVAITPGAPSADPKVLVDAAACSTLYGQGEPLDLSLWAPIQTLDTYIRDAVIASALRGDDAGNVTLFQPGGSAPAFGMNRLNHGAAIFFNAWRNHDAETLQTALNWCDNMFDLSLWWGDDDACGGTRYNNAVAAKARELDPAFMWRTNNASNFCTKGYDCFFYAYEETGDPRMAAALRGQVAYARKNVHTDQGECRNIGDVVDFVRLYRHTGQPEYLDEALRLFRELRTKLSEGGLFSQGGQPIEADPPFIDDDDVGYKHPFAKPYIIGYALAGLPELLELVPEEPKLREVVRAVADFLAQSQDPSGGWRYPHPRSARVLLGQSFEHAVQLARAGAVLEKRGESVDGIVDAIERTLQCQIVSVARTGSMAGSLDSWEKASGTLGAGKSIYDLYKKPADRDPARDYAEGAIALGGIPPEGLVYFQEILAFYLAHRPAERLLHSNPTLDAMFNRVPNAKPFAGDSSDNRDFDTYGMRAMLPKFHQAANARLTFPMAWPVPGLSFDAWRADARAVYTQALLTPPPKAAFAPCVLETEDRGSYEARKLAFNISADSRVLAYLLVPKGKGPFPAILALHDHGAHFSIGKEKVIRPFNVPQERLDDATKWTQDCYGGRWFGDELAKRGYLVFSTDALFWGDRGRAEGIEYKEQQTLAANLLQLGMSWAGNITWDDIRSAEFVQSLSEVDPERIGCAGLSMGSHRTWSLMAATDIVKAGAAICWMGDTKTLLGEGNNQTTGQSAFSMLHPRLRNALDFPDVAALACPKPMLFFNGEKDGLFPVSGVEACYAKMRRVWESQQASDKLVTKLWPVPHEFSVEMQEEAFQWLDRWLRP